MRNIREIADLAGKTVLVRASLNVPLISSTVRDDFRIRRAVATIKFLRSAGARVIIIAHIGRGGTESLEPVAHELKTHLLELRFIKTFEELQSSNADLILYENIRRDPREVANDEAFAKKLAELADIFVQDAFSVCHRKHASIVSLPKYLPSYAGLLLEEEVVALTRVREPAHPALFVLGGAKFDTKEHLIKEELEKFDVVHVNGALANDFFKVKGFNVGDSLISKRKPHAGVVGHKGLVLPESVLVRNADGEAESRKPSNVNDGEMIVDAFMPRVLLARVANGHFKTIVWNGPFGFYEGGFTRATEEFAHALVSATSKGSYSLVGGGDTIATLHKHDLAHEMSFISTGGGAMLEFLLRGTLVGIDALK